MATVPTTSDVSDGGMSGLKVGGAASIGGVLGRGILGPGLGTALGGTVAAAALDSNSDRDMAAALAVNQGMQELFAGGGGGDGSSSRGNERVM